MKGESRMKPGLASTSARLDHMLAALMDADNPGRERMRSLG
jgi:hypothetical protein